MVKHHGVPFLEKKQAKLLVNETNKNDILKILGSPSTKSKFDNDVWIYIERKQTQSKLKKLGRMKISKNDVLILEIDSYGMLKKKEFFNKDDMKNLKMSYEIEDNKNKKYFENYNDNLNENVIILTGMPCSGKTTLGKNLSLFLNYKFIDLDKEIEDYLGTDNLVDYIKENGFQKFRDAEYFILDFVLKNNNDKIILSCGGGIIEKGAMPISHRLVGNPFLTKVSRFLHKVPFNDMYCGMKMFRKSFLDKLSFFSTGMVFCMELVIKFHNHGSKSCELPIIFKKDGNEVWTASLS